MFTNIGILADYDITELLQKNIIKIQQPLVDDQIQPASLDLRLGKVAYRVRASFMPGNNNVIDKLKKFKLHEIDLTKGAVLETNCVYIVPLMESLELPENISAITNPKSSTGRLDIFTRIITDKTQEFDKISAGYKGDLYLEISPRTFPVIVHQGSRLSQIRFRFGQNILDKNDLMQLHKIDPLIANNNIKIMAGGVALSVDLTGDENGLVGYRGKRHTEVIDIEKINNYDILDFWEPIYQRGDKSLILDPNEFYILASKEFLKVPSEYAAEMVPFDPLVGEFRVHYAGFFDPGFGYSDNSNSKAVLEVRSHDVPFILEDGQIIGRLIYENMVQKPKNLYGSLKTSNYQGQGLKLSKHFKNVKSLFT
ncbi:2'-deoxycytidine 5'-triphosphate deaminase [Bartonella sp. DGB1]|uniref:2'-deoxycytidine 5'-triphosphate deaminase n=1 Tax=Bartonella sp. DGB1 TaxID=3239807 RepID=UPI0035256586